MKKLMLLSVISALMAGLLFVDKTYAIPVVDQSFQVYYDSATFSTNVSMESLVAFATHSQTITAGISGKLVRIDLPLYYDTNTQYNIFASINKLQNDLPSLSEPLFATTIPLSKIYGPVNYPDFIPWTTIDLSGSNIHLKAGDKYSVSLGTGIDDWNGVWWLGSVYNPYSGGDHYVLNPRVNPDKWILSVADYGTVKYNTDLSFRTWVDPATSPVPEPSTVLLLGAGLVGLGVYGRKVRKESKA